MSCGCNEDPIQYPCDFPIKIMGEKRDDFAQTMTDVIRLHDPLFDATTLGMRLSSFACWRLFLLRAIWGQKSRRCRSLWDDASDSRLETFWHGTPL